MQSGKRRTPEEKKKQKKHKDTKAERAIRLVRGTLALLIYGKCSAFLRVTFSFGDTLMNNDTLSFDKTHLLHFHW